MSIDTIIKHRTEKKEIRMSGELVMTKEEWLNRGGTYRGSIGTAARAGYYTVHSCELMKQPVTAEELANCKDFAMYKGCYMENCLKGGKRPCLPVFFREKEPDKKE